MVVEHNTIGPSGSQPYDLSFRKRDVNLGGWADGISHACANSVVRYNSVIDATDGGIVIFGATGSTISGNT